MGFKGATSLYWTLIREAMWNYSGSLFSVYLLFFIIAVTTDIWTKKADMPTPRMGHTTCVVDGKIYAIGGALTVKPPHPAVATVEVYIP